MIATASRMRCEMIGQPSVRGARNGELCRRNARADADQTCAASPENRGTLLRSLLKNGRTVLCIATAIVDGCAKEGRGTGRLVPDVSCPIRP